MIELGLPSIVLEGIPVYIRPGLIPPGVLRVMPLGDLVAVRGLPLAAARPPQYAVFAHSMEDVRRAVDAMNGAATASGPPEG